MIDEASKYLDVIDWDQRRVISITVDGEEDDESNIIEYIRRHKSELIERDNGTVVYMIHVSQAGELLSLHTELDFDMTPCVYYPFLQDFILGGGIQTVQRDKLFEVNRLGPAVDLVEYSTGSKGPSRLAVFKYYFLWQDARPAWEELNIWMRIPRHPNIVPFDRIVLDEIEGRVVGFTSAYIPGRTLEQNKSRVFKLKWLGQLTQVVDDLNLRYGIAHQDITARNLLVDHRSDCILLFDFNLAAPMRSSANNQQGGYYYRDDRNDIDGVVLTAYEIITRDETPRKQCYGGQSLDSLELDWVKHPQVRLDRPIEAYCQLLTDWRRQRTDTPTTGDAPPDAITYPPRPRPPHVTNDSIETWYEMRRIIRVWGDSVVNWERPPHMDMTNGFVMLATGEIIDRHHPPTSSRSSASSASRIP
ncbi:hypothetical protein M426DRAFT_9348 [Hypoxylon sp. CI-4A]|nr:hypothetical protein M426DRAFT_9348 [Hypoxylon sp. CI-4A]